MRIRSRRDVGGLPVNTLVVPTVVILALLHAAIIFVIVQISQTSANLSMLMQNNGRYTQDATSLLAGSSLLSETATNFVLLPTTENGEVNPQPLIVYAGELGVDRRGAQVVERFRTYDVSPEVLAAVEEAAASAEAMMESQLHAIELMRQVYPLPEEGPLASIPRYELTEDELALPDEAKLGAARQLVLDPVYAQNKHTVSQDINSCVEQMQATSGVRSAQTARRVGMMRMTLWIITLTIIVLLTLAFIVFYLQILKPLAGFVRTIPQDRPLDDRQGLREVRQVASAYNGVLKRRNALDDILRSAAEKDALTNLPNRYRFEQYLLEAEDSDGSMAVLLFDVNYLKQTNDTQGHLAGDELIRTAAECISDCFGDESEGNCFRFGGDEFAAVLKNCTPEKINAMIEHFRQIERERNVSVSLGYAYAEEIGNTSFRRLIDEADKHMYAEKELAHNQV